MDGLAISFLVSGALMQTASPEMGSPLLEEPEPPAAIFEDVLVLNRGESLGVPGSGVIWVLLPVKGQLPDGQTVFLYKTIGRPGEPAPPIGGRCRFETVRATWIGGWITGEHDLPRHEDYENGATPHVEMWLIERFDCTITSDSPVIVPPDSGWFVEAGS